MTSLADSRSTSEPTPRRACPPRWSLAAFAMIAALPSLAADAQSASRVNYVARADSLFQAGRVFSAETLYYYATRRSPRDARARVALGRYLAARGALRIGAVLLEEGRYFGGNAKEIAAYLAPTYALLRDYRALASLPGSPLPYAERARAEWLRDNAPGAAGADTVVVPLVPHDSTALGDVDIVIGADTLRTRIDPRESGLVLDTSWLRRPTVRVFASSSDRDFRSAMGVVRAAEIGALSLTGVPARFDPTGSARAARIGLSWLAAFSPTFDGRARTLTLRRDGRMPVQPAGERVPTLTYLTSGIWLIRRDGVWPIGGDGARALLAGHRWAVNSRAGEVIIAPL